MVHSLENALVIGSTGFIGRHFCRALPGALGLNRYQLDLCHPPFKIPEGHYQCAFITAGMGNPRACAHHPNLSYACNVVGTLHLGKELLKREILPIFFSSDYVLNDLLEVAPLNLYGEQKMELERRAIEMDALVIRLSKVYGVEKGDGTLFDEMAQHLSLGSPIKVAYDQIFSPIYVGDVVQRVLLLVQQGARGVVTLAGPRFASRLEMAERLADRLNVTRDLLHKISLDDLEDGIKRAKHLTLEGDFPALRWEEGIEKMVEAYE